MLIFIVVSRNLFYDVHFIIWRCGYVFCSDRRHIQVHSITVICLHQVNDVYVWSYSAFLDNCFETIHSVEHGCFHKVTLERNVVY